PPGYPRTALKPARLSGLQTLKCRAVAKSGYSYDAAPTWSPPYGFFKSRVPEALSCLGARRYNCPRRRGSSNGPKYRAASTKRPDQRVIHSKNGVPQPDCLHNAPVVTLSEKGRQLAHFYFLEPITPNLTNC